MRDILTRVPPRLRAALAIGTIIYFAVFISAFTGGASASEMLTLSGWQDFFAGREFEAERLGSWFLYGTSPTWLFINWTTLLGAISAIYFIIFNNEVIFRAVSEAYSEAIKKIPLLTVSWIVFAITWLGVISFYGDPYSLNDPREVLRVNLIIIISMIAITCFAIINKKVLFYSYAAGCFVIIGLGNWFLLGKGTVNLIQSSLMILGTIAAICFVATELRNSMKEPSQKS